jgi:hypothetical protein
MGQVLNFYHENIILYKAPKEEFKKCQIRAPGWPCTFSCSIDITGQPHPSVI